MDIKEIQKQFELYSNMYRALSGVAAALPIHDDVIRNILHYLDNAFLWVKESLQAASAIAQQEAQASGSVEGIQDASAPQDAKPAGT